MAYVATTDWGTPKGIARVQILTNFTTVGTAWNTLDCTPYVPAGTKVAWLSARCRMIGDGVTDTLSVWFAASGSPAQALPLEVLEVEHANLGAGLYTSRVLVFPQPLSSLTFQYSDMVKNSGTPTGRLDIVLFAVYL
jgi:hypothetical protein